MKLTPLLALAFSFQLSATVLSQQINMDQETNGQTVRNVLKLIENESTVRFFYNDDYKQLSDIVTHNISTGTIEEIIASVLEETLLTYKIVENNFVVVYPRESMQQVKITGSITDASSSEPLIGVNVVVEGSNVGVITDLNGMYSIEIVEKNATLVFSYIGYITERVAVAGKSVVDVMLIQDIRQLDEVVVIGYGTQKKVNLTGSVATISSKEIENRPLPNVAEVLRGVSPNLNISLTSNGGEPGASRYWNIRGIGSINGNDSPLILVDGVEADINNLNPQDIESVSILKDASASAIYGSRAPFGVVLVTTKRGKAGGMHIEYNNNFSFNQPLGISHMYDAEIFATVMNQVSANAGNPPVFADPQMERIRAFMAGTLTEEYDPNNPPQSIWQTRTKGNANYDWPYEYLSKNKIDQTHNINISGGTDRSQYYISLGYYNQGSFYAVGYDNYKRYNALANFTTRITDWLKFDMKTKYANTVTDYPLGITTVERDYFWTNLYLFGPNTPKYNIDGSYANPMYMSLKGSGRDKTTTNDFLMTLGAELEPIKGWKTNVSFNYNIIGSNQTVNPKPIPVKLGNGGYGNVGKPVSAYEDYFSNSPYALFNVVTSYEKTIGNHYFKALAGFEMEQNSYTWLYGRRDNLITNQVPSISTALGAITLDDSKWDWSTMGIFGRLVYNFKEKYLLEFSARYNGSSRFAPETRWGFFPSGSAGYQISKENFWQPIEPYINSLKIRASYGSLGNQNVSNYLYIPTIPINIETPWIIEGSRPPYAVSPDLLSAGLTWETVTTLNFGVDAEFLNNRLTLNFDQFTRKTSDMFGPQGTLPYTLGTGTPYANNAEMETKGFELILGWRDRLANDFSYNIQLSIGHYKATILSYLNENGIINDWYQGKQVGEIWGFETDKILQTQEEADQMPDQSALYPLWGPGDIKYKDLNGDKEITYGAGTLDDHGDQKVIGNTTPKYNVGISGGFNWRGFDFNMHWIGLGHRDYSPTDYSTTFWGANYSYLSSAVLKGSPVLDYWRPADETNILGPNTDAYLPRTYGDWDMTYKNRLTQSKYLLNAAYLRLKIIQLGYTLPSSLTRKLFIEKTRIFISASNLLTITKLPKSIDPEQSIGIEHQYGEYGGFYPMAKTFSVGLNLTF